MFFQKYPINFAMEFSTKRNFNSMENINEKMQTILRTKDVCRVLNLPENPPDLPR